MRYIEYPDLQDGFYQEVLPNGLTLRIVTRKGFAKTYAFYAMDYGSIDTQFVLGGETFVTPDGVAHYLEHKMFDMPYGDAMNRFAELGGNPNAFTSHTMTAYYVECTENLRENIKTLLEFVSLPYFTQKSVDKERGIIGQEIRMYLDSADSRVYDNLFAAMYHAHPVRVPIAGTEASIAKITPEILELCHKAFYAPSNGMLCVMGDVEPEEIRAWVEEYLPGVKFEKAKSVYGTEPVTCAKQRVEDTMEVAMPTFVAGFKDTPAAPGFDALRQEFTGDLAADLLLSASAPLYTKLYEQGLIESGFSAGYEGLKGMSIFSAGGDSKDPDGVVAAILHEAENCHVDRKLFERLKKASMGRKLREMDGFENVCFRSCAYFFEGAEYFDALKALQSITAEDVEKYIRTVIRPENMCVSVIWPEGGN